MKGHSLSHILHRDDLFRRRDPDFVDRGFSTLRIGFPLGGVLVSIVYIRFALTEGYPYGAPLAILAMVFGMCVLLVFNYPMKIHE